MNDKTFDVYDCTTNKLLGQARGIQPASSASWCLITEDLQLIAKLRTKTDVEFRAPGGRACMRFWELQTTGDGLNSEFVALCSKHEYLE